ncbi:MAG: hypothetical protein WBF76_16920, partial [Pseudonocardiaceae bacterium]
MFRADVLITAAATHRSRLVTKPRLRWGCCSSLKSIVLMGARFDPAGYQQTAAISDQRYIGP